MRDQEKNSIKTKVEVAVMGGCIYICKYVACRKKGWMFEYAPIGCKNQIVTATRPHTILDMRPSTMNNPTSNQDPKFTAPPKYTLV